MELVSHSDSFRDQRIDRKSVLHRTERLAKRRAKNVSHPAQTVYNLFVICAETKHLADTFIHRTVSLIAARLILYYEYCHVRGCDTAHRTYRVAVVAWDELDLSAL